MLFASLLLILSTPAPIIAAHRLPVEAVFLRANWQNGLLLLGMVTILRIAYSIWLSPWELTGDEAYYWVQSQHVSLSYAEKGPLLAWILAIFCKVLGSSEWVVRLPVLLASSLAAWWVGLLALKLTQKNQLAGFLAIVITLLIPSLQANAQICTQDGLEIPLLVALTAAGLYVIRRSESGESTWVSWMMVYALIGVGMLLKQSMLLFLVALPIYAFIRRKKIQWSMAIVLQQIVGLMLVLAMMTPILIWESRNGWPLLHHTLGHLGAGEDQVSRIKSGNTLTWLGNTLGSLIGATGPAIVVMIWASVRAYRERGQNDAIWRDRLWLMCAAWPAVGFFVLLSLKKPVVPSWPLPLIVPLIPLAAEFAATELSRYRNLIQHWDKISKKPMTGFWQLWSFLVIYGLIGAFVLAFPTSLGHLPVIGPKISKGIIKKFTTYRTLAVDVMQALQAHPNVGVVVAPHYQKASGLTFYLPRNYTVTCAGSYVADRFSNYDTWPQTAMDQKSMMGKDMLLVGNNITRWTDGLSFEQITPQGDAMFVGEHFLGVIVTRADKRHTGDEE